MFRGPCWEQGVKGKSLSKQFGLLFRFSVVQFGNPFAFRPAAVLDCFQVCLSPVFPDCLLNFFEAGFPQESFDFLHFLVCRFHCFSSRSVWGVLSAT